MSPDSVLHNEVSRLSGNEDESDDAEVTTGHLKRDRLSSLKRKTRAKTKSLFHTSDGHESGCRQDEPILEIEKDLAFNSSWLLNGNTPKSASRAADKTLGAILSAGRAVVHPIDAIKSKVIKITASQLSKAERPFLSQTSDLEYLQAHDDLKRVESTRSSQQGTWDEEHDALVGNHRDRLREMESQREGLQVAWTTSRHVRRVRVVPKRHIEQPKMEDFAERDEQGMIVKHDWLRWLGYNLIYYTQDFSIQYIDDFDELPFSVDSSRHYIERLVLASAPWQSWAMDVRSVYRWEIPKVTTKWFVIYLILWYTQHVMGFLYGYIIYIVFQNRYYPTNVQTLRNSMKRALDNQGKAYQLGELIDKHGRHEWLDPVMDDIGPYLQLQLGDMANMLEVFANFYHWKYPRKTLGTLFFFSSCLLISLFADMAFCMKIFWFIAGGSFFLCWPISSLYPKYRYLVSPFKWILWDVPTHAEWSFQYLRLQAQKKREDLIKRKVEESHVRKRAAPAINRSAGQVNTIPRIQVEGDVPEDHLNDSSGDESWQSASSTTSVLEAGDIRSFRARCGGTLGRLIVFSNGIRFVRSVKHTERWRLLFVEMEEMRKVEGNRLSKIVSSADQLELKDKRGRMFSVEGMKERDEAFNAILAFSGLQWQSLQTKHDTREQGS